MNKLSFLISACIKSNCFPLFLFLYFIEAVFFKNHAHANTMDLRSDVKSINSSEILKARDWTMFACWSKCYMHRIYSHFFCRVKRFDSTLFCEASSTWNKKRKEKWNSCKKHTFISSPNPIECLLIRIVFYRRVMSGYSIGVCICIGLQLAKLI